MTGGVVTLGETMGLFTARSPGRREDSFRLGIGGAESNVAIGLARLGTPATWIGRVGADSAGELVRRELRAEAVTALITVDEDAPTGLMVKTQPIAGVSRVDYHRRGSAGSRLGPDDIDPEVVRRAAVLHVTGITPALSASAAAAVRFAIATAVDAGVPVSFDINHRARLWEREADAVEVYREIAASATVLFAGEDEASLLAPPGPAKDLARALSRLGPTQILIKGGARGCVALIDDELLQVEAIAVPVLDSVGAGDAFAAGFLAELLSGAGADARVLTAVRSGAFACLGAGDWESLPRREDLALLEAEDPVVR